MASNTRTFQKQDTPSDIIVTSFCTLDNVALEEKDGIHQCIIAEYKENTRITGILNSKLVVNMLQCLFRTRVFETSGFITQERLKVLIGCVDYVSGWFAFFWNKNC